MKILMLGWEYPPHIAGGLGTACHGLTTALAEQGIDIHFVVPEIVGDEPAEHMVLSDLERRVAGGSGSPGFFSGITGPKVPTSRVPAFLAPYWGARHFREAHASAVRHHAASVDASRRDEPMVRALIDGEVYGVDVALALQGDDQRSLPGRYGRDIFSEVQRFTKQVVSQFSGGEFDIIHAHDWMTFPAAVALAETLRKPLVVHVHSLEHDRSGLFVDKQIEQIERLGVERADKVIAVSYFTKRLIEQHHRVSADKIAVVHNGVYPRQAVNDYRLKKTWPRNVVLFLGRVTFQKGPEYFVEVASRVIPHIPNVLFVLAGTGDMLPAVMEQVRTLRLTENFMFPGFVKGEELEELFSVADLYVMPSVSEPFGITALEAISFDTPVIISKQSGVAEVIQNALKVDFWDTDRMADLIVNSLLHPELREDLARKAREELKDLHWDAAAIKTIDIYRDVSASIEPCS